MKGFLTVLAMIASAGGGLWVYRDSTRRMAITPAPPTIRMPAVECIHLKKSSIEDGVELVGGLEAHTDVELRSEISAYIVKLLADCGDYVEKGQVVAELDHSKLHESVSHADANLQLAKAQLQAQQMRFAQSTKNFERQSELARSGVNTPQQREDAETQMRISKAEVDLEQARVAQAETDLLRTKLALDDSKIVSPMTGFVAERHVDVGELSKPDAVLMRIVDISVVKTVVHIVEREYPKIALGQEARIAVDAFPDRHFVGKVVRKSPILDPLTRTAEVSIEIANAEKLLKPGMHARVRLVFGRHKEAHVLPVAALREEGERNSVFVVSGNPARAVVKRVRTGYADGDIVEILSGLGPRDRVVVSGTQFLKEGVTVAAIDRDAAVLASSETPGTHSVGTRPVAAKDGD